MDYDVNAIGFELAEEQRELILKKLDRIKYAEDLIVDTKLKVKEDKKKYIFDCTVNFRWGGTAHVSADDYDFTAALNKLMDTLDQKVRKEKDKVQDRN
jgi:putative sigma-54 modulation protein